jgi:hypothetical protein
VGLIASSSRAIEATLKFLVLVALFFLLRWRDGPREGQRQRVAVVGLAWPRFCMSALLSITNRLLRLM